jgi:hypothetical protein
MLLCLSGLAYLMRCRVSNAGVVNCDRRIISWFCGVHSGLVFPQEQRIVGSNPRQGVVLFVVMQCADLNSWKNSSGASPSSSEAWPRLGRSVLEILFYILHKRAGLTSNSTSSGTEFFYDRHRLHFISSIHRHQGFHPYVHRYQWFHPPPPPNPMIGEEQRKLFFSMEMYQCQTCQQVPQVTP